MEHRVGTRRPRIDISLGLIRPTPWIRRAHAEARRRGGRGNGAVHDPMEALLERPARGRPVQTTLWRRWFGEREATWLAPGDLRRRREWIRIDNPPSDFCIAREFGEFGHARNMASGANLGKYLDGTAVCVAPAGSRLNSQVPGEVSDERGEIACRDKAGSWLHGERP
jgi:hypothetical protein